MTSRFYLGLFILLTFLLTGCAAGEQITPTATFPPPTETQPLPTATASPTNTATVLPSATASRTPAPTATQTPTATQPPVPPALTVIQNAVCRSGPGTRFDIVGYFVPDDQPAVIGVAEMQPWMENPWWYIEAANGKRCFISDTVVSVDGETEILPQLTPAPTPTPKPPSSIGDGENIFYFLAALDTGGPFGCGDSLFYITTSIERTGDLEVDIANALNALFSNHNKYTYDLYNPLYYASLRVSKVKVSPDGAVEVYLAGNFKRPQDQCERILIHDQVWKTITLQFSGISGHPVIWKQGALLGDLLEP